MSTERLEAYVATLSAEGVQLLPKAESRLNRAIDKILRVLTLGGQSRYMTDVVTTLGKRIYLPESWESIDPDERYCILRHERVHVAQFRRYTWPGMIFLYILCPLPFAFAPGRAWLEWQGYRETLTATWEVFGPERASAASFEDDIVRRFTGPDYGWMWMRGRTISKAIRKHLKALHDANEKK